MVLEEEDLTKETLTSTVYKLFEKRGSYVDAMRNSNQQDSIDTIISMITQASK
jgi:UDP-N-acetylglucosamine--N-acetylmuramyl-(pentapeptide) pyrophosphoryl-undecaprenol N-acetylglucosamine transferase